MCSSRFSPPSASPSPLSPYSSSSPTKPSSPAAAAPTSSSWKLPLSTPSTPVRCGGEVKGTRRWKNPTLLRDREKECACGLDDDDEYEYVEEGPAEIIWQGNEIIVKKKRVKVAKRSAEEVPDKEDDDRPTSNPLPPQSAAFSSYVQSQSVIAQEVLDNVTQLVPNFGTEQV